MFNVYLKPKEIPFLIEVSINYGNITLENAAKMRFFKNSDNSLVKFYCYDVNFKFVFKNKF